MGKLTLLLVMVAMLGGSLLTSRTQRGIFETESERRDVQGDMLARGAATSGHGLVLSAMIGGDGFRSSLGFMENDVRDGRFTVDAYTLSDAGQTVDFTVTGHFGGATHTIRSKYVWDSVDFPGPIWLDVPYATADLDPNTFIDGGPDALPVHFDDRRYNEMDLSTLLPWGTMEGNLTSEFGGASGAGGDFQASDMLASGYLEDVNAFDATDLYSAGLGAMGGDDITIAGPHTYSGTTQNFGATPLIVRITGSLTINDATVEGNGLLIVEGPITMTGTSPVLRWNGIVLVHTEDSFLPVAMGDAAVVDIAGALIVDHVAVPPGGHMDLTINLENDGDWGSSPIGINGVLWNSTWPWYQHTHRFDEVLPEEKTVYFAEEGSDRHELRTQFRSALNNLGSTPVYLEFYHPEMHGYASFTLDIAGQPQVYTGSVGSGFGLFSDDNNSFRTQAFDPTDLQTFIVDVKSLRMLKKAWDTEDGCSDIWPRCVGSTWERGGALAVRIRREADDAIFYEASLYWHMRRDEVAETEYEEAQLRNLIESGGLFGTDLTLGPNVQITFDIGQVMRIGSRLGFDETPLVNMGVWTTHRTPREYRAMGEDSTGAGGGPGRGTSSPAPPD